MAMRGRDNIDMSPIAEIAEEEALLQAEAAPTCTCTCTCKLFCFRYRYKHSCHIIQELT